MPNPDTPPLTRAVVLRGVGFALAVALGGVAVWLIVTSTTQKRIEIGVLTGLWGLLLGAYSMFGSRRSLHYGEELLGAPRSGAALALRPGAGALERADDLAERRAFQAGLEEMLRREVQTAVHLEVGELRSEIAALRSELLEKVGGQIRLERIETTRVIGSDLEALQQEVRRLNADREAAVPRATDPPVVHVIEQAKPAVPVAATSASDDVDAAPIPLDSQRLPDLAGAIPVAPPTALRPPAAKVAPAASPASRPADAMAAPAAAMAPAPPVSPARADEPLPPDDPLAGLPRIRPFTEFALDPIEPSAPAPPPTPAAPVANGSSHAVVPRRHAAPDEPDGETASPRRASGPTTPRRHRRAEDSDAGQELLARLLAREGS